MSREFTHLCTHLRQMENSKHGIAFSKLVWPNTSVEMRLNGMRSSHWQGQHIISFCARLWHFPCFFLFTLLIDSRSKYSRDFRCLFAWQKRKVACRIIISKNKICTIFRRIFHLRFVVFFNPLHLANNDLQFTVLSLLVVFLSHPN